MVQCHAYGEVLCQIAGDNGATPEILLKAPKFNSMTLMKDNNIIEELKHSSEVKPFGCSIYSSHYISLLFLICDTNHVCSLPAATARRMQ